MAAKLIGPYEYKEFLDAYVIELDSFAKDLKKINGQETPGNLKTSDA